MIWQDLTPNETRTKQSHTYPPPCTQLCMPPVSPKPALQAPYSSTNTITPLLGSQHCKWHVIHISWLCEYPGNVDWWGAPDSVWWRTIGERLCLGMPSWMCIGVSISLWKSERRRTHTKAIYYPGHTVHLNPSTNTNVLRSWNLTFRLRWSIMNGCRIQGRGRRLHGSGWTHWLHH